MAPNPLNYRSAPNAPTPPLTVQVERATTGQAVVRVSYSHEEFRKMVTRTVNFIAMGFCVSVAFAVLGFAMTASHGALPNQGWAEKLLPILFRLIPAVAMILFAVPLAFRLRQSYLIEADSDGITIQSYRGRREWCERLPLEQITDVRIGSRLGNKVSGPVTCLVIAVKPWWRFNRRILNGLGGDDLVCVADALRSGIGQPARS